MSAEVVTHAKGMADFIVRRAHRGPGDTIDAAMHRAERLFGAPAQWLHRLRYRELRDLPASAFFAIQKAHQRAEEASERAYQHERALADARNSSMVRLADFVAGPQVAREEERP